MIFNRWRVVRYIIILSLFILCASLVSALNIYSPNKNYVPDLPSIFLFYSYLKSNFNSVFYINVFLYGLIVDTLALSYLGTSGISWLLAIKSVSLFKTYCPNLDKKQYTIYSFIIFILLFNFFRWFILSFLSNSIYNFSGILISCIVNSFYFIMLFFGLEKLKLRYIY